MIDYFALALPHALIVIALLRLMVRPDLDREEWDFTAEGDHAAPTSATPTAREAKRARRNRRSKEAGDA